MSSPYSEVPQELPHPEKRFGHTITMISKERAVVFGGAVGDNIYKITNDTFCYNSITNKWTTLKPKSQDEAPSPRAAHGATAVESNQMVIFGGAHSHGNLVDNDLYLLKLSSTETLAKWVKVPVENAKPTSRYGHAMVFFKPYILVIGGNIGNEPCNEVWALSIDKNPFFWNKLEFKELEPAARVYHTSCIWRSTNKVDMVLMFGGRNNKNVALNDMWGLRRHKNSLWDWVKAPIKNENYQPMERYQHTMLCSNNLALLVGGRNNNINDRNEVPMEVYNLETSEWHSFPGISRFRHVTWIYNNLIMTHGGFENTRPNQPTSVLLAADLAQMFANFPELLKNVDRGTGDGGQTGLEQHGEYVDEGKANPFQRIKINPQITVVHFKDDRGVMQSAYIGDLKQENQKLIENDMNVLQKTEDYIVNLYNTVLKHFLKPADWKYTEGAPINLRSEIILALCEEVIKVLKKDPPVIRLNPGVKIIGSIHGQFGDLMRFFNTYGVPDNDPVYGAKSDIEALDYLFLGNYVDRGRNSLEVVCTLFALKLKFPDHIFLLRGSHEDRKVNFNDGLGLECETRIGEDITSPKSVFNKINEVFECLSYAAIIDKKIFCVHSGIGTSLRTIDEIERLKKPFVLNHSDQSNREQRLVLDLLWSDPVLDVNDFDNKVNEVRENMPNGPAVRFGINRINEFLSTNKMSIIVRSHECVPDGAEVFGSTQLYTVFSCTDYAGVHNNEAAIFHHHHNTKKLNTYTLPVIKGFTKWYQQAQPKRTEQNRKYASSVGADMGNVEGKDRPVTPLRRMTKNS